MTDILLTGIGHITTNDGDPMVGAAIGVDQGRITFVGEEGDAPEQGQGDHIDCGGRAVIPGFVDAHTHLVFAGDRSAEFSRRMAGSSYVEIAQSGGGILSTVAATRAASNEDLIASAGSRLTRMIEGGTTSVEIKSGYGLDLDTEIRILQVARSLGETHPIDVRTTFLGAHSIPPEYAHRREEYVGYLIDEMLPAVSGLADYCDVFVERGVFSVEEAREILGAAAEHGMKARVHAEQLSHSGGAMLAAEVGAVSADHLDFANADDAAALAAAGVSAVLVPGASYMLRTPQAPGPMLWDAGCTVALATDCNPGTSYFETMVPIISLAVVQMGLTTEQAVWAATRGGALSLGMEDRGILKPGARADILVLDAPTPDHVPYRPASNLVWRRIHPGETLDPK